MVQADDGRVGGFDASGCHLFPHPTETAMRLSYRSRFPHPSDLHPVPPSRNPFATAFHIVAFSLKHAGGGLSGCMARAGSFCGNGFGGHTSISLNTSSASDNGANSSSLRPSVVSAIYNMLGQSTSPCTYSIAMPLLVSPLNAGLWISASVLRMPSACQPYPPSFSRFQHHDPSYHLLPTIMIRKVQRHHQLGPQSARASKQRPRSRDPSGDPCQTLSRSSLHRCTGSCSRMSLPAFGC